MEKQNSKNAYICNLLHSTVTVHKDAGTTPMFLSCLTCGKRAVSRMGQVDDSLIPTHEWYKPTDEDCIAEAERISQEKETYKYTLHAIREHVAMGGLLLRKIV